MSSEDIKHTFDSISSKQFFATTIKLNGANYLLWAQSFYLFIGLQNKLKIFSKDPQQRILLLMMIGIIGWLVTVA